MADSVNHDSRHKVMENKQQSEIVAVQDLLELLDLKGVVFTMDALHCQKSGCDPQRLTPQSLAWQDAGATRRPPTGARERAPSKQYQQLLAVAITT